MKTRTVEQTAQALECGDSSPLSAGDLSPSHADGPVVVRAALVRGVSARRPARRGLADKSAKQKSGDESPHSKAHLAPLPEFSNTR